MYTEGLYTDGNLAFFDRDLFPSSSATLWADCPLLPALTDPAVGFHFFDHFFRLPKSAEDWVLTQATSGTATIGTEKGGNLALNAGATTDGQGPQLQLAGLSFLPAASKHIWFECRCKVNVLTTDLFLGLCEVDTTIADTTGLTTSNSIGFKSFTGNGVIVGQSEKATAEGTVAALTTLVTGTWVRLGFKLNGVTSVTFYVNGVANGTTLLTANIPIVGLTPSFVCHATGTGTPQLDVDWVRGFQLA